MHRLRRMRPRLSGNRHFCSRRFAGEVGQLHTSQRRLVRQKREIAEHCRRRTFCSFFRRHFLACRLFLVRRCNNAAATYRTTLSFRMQEQPRGAPTLSLLPSSTKESDHFGEACLHRIRIHSVLAIAFLCPMLASAVRSQTQSQPSHKSAVRRNPETLEGNWAGSLQAGDAVLHLVLHVSKADVGSYKATIDSLDQGVYGIEVTDISLKDLELHFSIASVGARFEG